MLGLCVCTARLLIRQVTGDDFSQPQPMLAESWDVSSDYTRIKLNLRKAVQYHSGREFTSDDVKYNLLRVRQPNVGAQFTNMSKWWTSIETPDKYTVQLTSDQQPFLQGYLPILSLSLSKKYGFSPLNYDTGAGFVTPDNYKPVSELAKAGIR